MINAVYTVGVKKASLFLQPVYDIIKSIVANNLQLSPF